MEVKQFKTAESTMDIKGDEIIFPSMPADLADDENGPQNIIMTPSEEAFLDEGGNNHEVQVAKAPTNTDGNDDNNNSNSKQSSDSKIAKKYHHVYNKRAPPGERAQHKSPIKDLRPKMGGKWYNHKTKTTHTDKEVLNNVTTFVFCEAKNEYCFDAKGRETKCSCLHDIVREESNGTITLQNCANALFYEYFKLIDAEAKHQYLLKEIRHADAYESLLEEMGKLPKKSKPKNFLMPSRAIPPADTVQVSDETNRELIQHNSESTSKHEGRNTCNNKNSNNQRKKRKKEIGPFICIWAFCRLYAIGSFRFNNYFGRGNANCTNGGAPAPSFKKTLCIGNNNRGKRFEEAYSSIELFLEALKTETAEPMSTPLADVFPRPLKSRGKAKTHAPMSGSEDHPTAVRMQYLLPPNMSQRKLYEQWVWSRGWVVKHKSTKSNQLYPISEWDKREHDEYEWPLGSESKDIVSLECFRKYWNENFPNLCVRDFNTMLTKEKRSQNKQTKR